MNGLLTDADLTRLLTEAAESFPVPDPAPLLDRADAPAAGVPLYRRRWAQGVAAAAAAVVAIVLAGSSLGGGSGHALTASPTGGSLPNLSHSKYQAPGVATGLTRAPSGTGPVNAPNDSQAALRSVGSTAATVAGSPSGGGVASLAGALPPAAAPAAAPAVDGARVVKTGEISLVVKNGLVSPTLTAVGDAAKAYGGYISTSDTQEYGSTPSGTITLRVPVEKFDALVTRIRSLHASVRTATLSGRDVTAEYTDLQAQLTTLKAARERFLLLLSKATSIGDILTVQQKVDDATSQIDRLEGQRRVLAAQSDLATLAVTVTQADDPVVTPIAKPHSGLTQAFLDAKDGFVTGVEALIRRSGRALLFLVCLGVVLVLARFGWRAVRRRMV